MKKESFEFLKTLASLENCIECIQVDVKQMLARIPEGAEIDRDGIENRANHLKYWLNQLIHDYDA